MPRKRQQIWVGHTAFAPSRPSYKITRSARATTDTPIVGVAWIRDNGDIKLRFDNSVSLNKGELLYLHLMD